jgi:hypothetical protein
MHQARTTAPRDRAKPPVRGIFLVVAALVLGLLFYRDYAFGADVEVPDMPEATANTTDDLFMIIDNPGGTPISKKITAANVNAGTASALLNNGGNCSAGSFPLGVDQAGAIESCTDAFTEAEADAVDFVVGTAQAGLTSERVGTDTATIDVDIGTAAQMKWNVIANSIGPTQIDETASYSWSGSHSYTALLKSVWFGAGSLSTDGTQCANPAEVTINSGPKIWTVICTDNDASTMYGSIKMPDGWNGGTVTFQHIYLQTAANTGALNGDIAAQCRGNGEVPSSTWGTEIAIDDAAVVGSNSNDMTTSAAVTPAGTCAAGDMLYFRYQLDAAGTTTTAATLHHLGFLMKYTVTTLTD